VFSELVLPVLYARCVPFGEAFNNPLSLNGYFCIVVTNVSGLQKFRGQA
jgi:hypothetical protein